LFYTGIIPRATCLVIEVPDVGPVFCRLAEVWYSVAEVR
jgi:hypothetical protein